MLAALALCCATVLAAATPGVALGVGGLNTARDRLAAAELATRATALAQTLADERDTLAVRAARQDGGDDASGDIGLTPADRARADREAADVVAAGAPADLRGALGGLAAARSTALAGRGGPQGVVAAYRPLVAALEHTAGPGTAALGRASDAAAVQRALLVAALAAGGSQRVLVSAAQSAHLQEQAALATFRETADAGLLARYDSTVTGPDAEQADHDLTTLLDAFELGPDDRDLTAATVNAALTARIGLMRSVVSSAAADDARAASAERHHQVTVIELRAALALLCLLLVVAVLINLFRGISRPLAGLHRWARSDDEAGQGVQVTGTDEFAAIARRVNALTQQARTLRDRVDELTADRVKSADSATALTAERDELLRTRQDLMRSREEIAVRLKSATTQKAAHITFVNLSLRTLGLVERQLALIDSLEDREQDPDRLATLFRLDHLATRMRRNSENLLVLTGTEHAHGATVRPVPLVDVARAAVSEVERYERVVVQGLPEVHVAGRAADDISHLIAELLDNAAAFSEPKAEVRVTGWQPDGGEVVLQVADTGIGVPPERLGALNELLDDADPAAPGAVSGMGLYVVARLAHRHGVRVQLRQQTGGGTAAVVVLPQVLLPSPSPDAPATPVEAALARRTAPAAPAAPAAPSAPTTPAAPAAPAVTRPRAASGPAPTADHAPALPASTLPAQVGPAPAVPAPAIPAQVAPARTVPPAAAPATARTPARHASGPAVPPPPAGSRASTGAQTYTRAETNGGAAPQPHPVHAGDTVPDPGIPALTAKGLPQRVPRSTGLNGEPMVRPSHRPARAPVDAEDLRRRLGGLQRGLHAGRRDAEQEISTGTVPVAGGGAPARPEQAQQPAGPPAPGGNAGGSTPPQPGATKEATR